MFQVALLFWLYCKKVNYRIFSSFPMCSIVSGLVTPTFHSYIQRAKQTLLPFWLRNISKSGHIIGVQIRLGPLSDDEM